MYEIFKKLLESVEKIGNVEKAELSDYKNGWVTIRGTLESGHPFDLRFLIEDKKDGN